MKECCKTGNEKPQSKLKILATRITWGIVILVVIGLAIEQIFNF